MGKPKIRFKGFTEDWEQRKLGEIVERVSTTGTSGKGLASVEYEDVVSEQGLLNKNIYQKETIKTGVRFSGEDVLYGKLRPYLHNWLNPDFSGIAVGDWWVLKPINIDKNFLYRLIQSPHFDDMANQSSGTKMPRADWKLMSNTEFCVPSNIEEQAKIGAYFCNLDHLITLHQRKCDETKKLKKYMLQKMFPQNGANVPEIRFDGFTDAWEQRKLNDISEIVTGTTPPTKEKNNYGGVKLFVSPADIQSNRYVNNTITTLTDKGFDLGRKLRPGTSLFVSIGSTIGKVAQIKDFATTNQQINAVIPFEFMDDDYIFSMLEKEATTIKRLSAQQAVPIINKRTFGEIEIMYPSKEEQKKIGRYFTELDHLITLHQRKCNGLKKIRKFMLQNMFV